MNSTLTIRIDEQTKQEFTDIVNALGLDPPTAVRMLIQQTVNQKTVQLGHVLTDSDSGSTMDFLDNVHADWEEW
jgi:addiction module RelB/DinJ family antitoxin